MMPFQSERKSRSRVYTPKLSFLKNITSKYLAAQLQHVVMLVEMVAEHNTYTRRLRNIFDVVGINLVCENP